MPVQRSPTGCNSRGLRAATPHDGGAQALLELGGDKLPDHAHEREVALAEGGVMRMADAAERAVEASIGEAKRHKIAPCRSTDARLRRCTALAATYDAAGSSRLIASTTVSAISRSSAISSVVHSRRLWSITHSVPST